MSAARGDTKPCHADACAGTMQFGRRSDNLHQPGPAADPHPAVIDLEAKGWVCNREASHFELAVR